MRSQNYESDKLILLFSEHFAYNVTSVSVGVSSVLGPHKKACTLARTNQQTDVLAQPICDKIWPNCAFYDTSMNIDTQYPLYIDVIKNNFYSDFLMSLFLFIIFI